MNKTVANVLRRKTVNIISITPDTTVLNALRIMADRNIGSIIIMSDGKYEGIMTERDYARKVVLKNKMSAETPVEEIMSSNWPKVTPEDSIEHCMQLMSERNIRYLPVFEDNNIVGIVSINDLVKETISSQQETINHLHNYVHSVI